MDNKCPSTPDYKFYKPVHSKVPLLTEFTKVRGLPVHMSENRDEWFSSQVTYDQQDDPFDVTSFRAVIISNKCNNT